MSVQRTYETIEAYLNGTLTGAELSAFEQALATDKALADQVQLFRNLDTALEDKPVLDFQKMVQEEGIAFLQNATPKKTVPIRYLSRYRAWAVAAVLLTLVVSTVVFWNIQSNVAASGSELFAQNFETYDLNQNMRSGVTETSTFENGIRQYQAKNFSSAIKTFQGLVQANDQDMVLRFCLANAYLNQDPAQLEQAETQLQAIIQNGESIYVPRAKWYQALILLKKENTTAAKKLLNEVADSPDRLGTKAKELLETLN